MPDKPRRKRRSFSKESKQTAGNLFVKQRYSCKDAAEAVGVSQRSSRDGHEKLAADPEPCGDDATADQ